MSTRSSGPIRRLALLIVAAALALGAGCEGQRRNQDPPPSRRRKPSPPSGKRRSPFEGTILFQSDADGDDEIYALTSDGVRKLTDNAWSDGYPRWSPDGARIAFAANPKGNFDVFAMNPDGTGIAALVDTPADETEPDWRPDGSGLAFTRGDEEAWAIDFATRAETRLVPDFSRTHGILDFSPVGAARGLHRQADSRLGRLQRRPRFGPVDAADERRQELPAPLLARRLDDRLRVPHGRRHGRRLDDETRRDGEDPVDRDERDGRLFSLLVARRDGDRLLLRDRALPEGRPLDPAHPRRRDATRAAAFLRGGARPLPGLALSERTGRMDPLLSFQRRSRGRPLRHGRRGKYRERVPEMVRRYLDWLRERGAKTTFFVVGDVAEAYPGLIAEIAAAGHEIGCHSYPPCASS